MSAPPALSTPEVAFCGLQTPAQVALPPPPPASTRVLASTAQLLVGAAIATFVFGQLYVFTDSYDAGLRVAINQWWGVPHAVALVNSRGWPPPQPPVIGHAEMVRPTFAVLFFVLPLVVSVLLVDWLRTLSLRRVTAQSAFRVAQLLRRKPRVLGRLSHWSYGEWLFFVGFVLLGNALAFLFGFRRRLTSAQISAAKLNKSLALDDYLELVGVTLGFTTIYNLAFLFLPATRNSAWLEFFNLSYTNAIKYHRWLGVVTVLMAVAHCATFYWLWLRKGTWRQEALPCFDCPLDTQKGHSVWFNVFGELALLCFFAIALTSLPCVRRRLYNVFYYTHQLLFLAVVLAVMHWGPTIWWVLPAFSLYLISRAVSVTNGASPVVVNEMTALSSSLVHVMLHRATGPQGQYKVGQFLYLNVPAISKLQWHAFTIADSPLSHPTTMTVLVKALGDWTSRLAAHAYECRQKNVLPTIYVDGFYGASLELYDEYVTLCLVAGGIGVTPVLAVLDDLTAKLSMAAGDPTLLPTQRVVFMFSFRELPLLEQIVPTLARLRELDPTEQWITFHLRMTAVLTDDILDAKLAHGTVSTHQQPITQYADPSRIRRAFTQPLQSSRCLKALAVGGTVLIAVLLVVYLEFGKNGPKIKRNGAQLWPSQQFVEIAAVIVATLVVHAMVGVEYVLVTRRSFLSLDETTKHTERDSSLVSHAGAANRQSLQTLQVHTYRDLLNEWGVRVGERLAIAKLLQQVYEQHGNLSFGGGNTTIGVIATGPDALKRAVGEAISQIDSAAFDLREEEFDL